MCDLLGMSFRLPVSAKVSLDLFQKRGSDNPDGWGMAYYTGNLLQVVKEAGTASGSVLFDFMERYHLSHITITHVRKSTRGGRSYLNTHPFYRSLMHGSIRREYSFAHNGTLTRLDGLSQEGMVPLGETDSERAFCHLLGAIHRRGISEWNVDEFRFVAGILAEMNEGENTLNCIFSDGERLFCYSDREDHNSGLRFTRQSTPYQSVALVSPKEQLGRIDIHTDPADVSQNGYIVSTRKLMSKDWSEFDRGELIVFERGEIVYPQERATV